MNDNLTPSQANPDVILIGAGIMSATLGMMLKQLQPELTIEIFERLDVAAAESSDAWNNAGTGHSAFCELNYTPEKPDGSVETDKAIKIAESFEVSKQFWAYLLEHNLLKVPSSFIKRIPHASFVWGDKNVAFLKQRVALLKQHHLFADMQYSEDFAQLQAWMPLMMAERNTGRDDKSELAASYVAHGSDVDFGALTRYMVTHLSAQKNFNLLNNTQVKKLKKINHMWHVSMFNKATKPSMLNSFF